MSWISARLLVCGLLPFGSQSSDHPGTSYADLDLDFCFGLTGRRSRVSATRGELDLVASECDYHDSSTQPDTGSSLSLKLLGLVEATMLLYTYYMTEIQLLKLIFSADHTASSRLWDKQHDYVP